MNVPMRPVGEIARSLRDAINHIEGATGADLHRGRLQSYLTTMDRAANGEHVDAAALWNAVLESADIESAVTLRPEALLRVGHRIGTLSGGPSSPDGEHDPGRDLAFELVTASLMQPIDPNVDLDRVADVSLVAEGHPLLIECKRPSSDGAFRRRVIEGYRQQSEHRRAGHAGFGAIAVDLGLLVNPQNGILPAQTYEDAIDFLYEHIRQWMQAASEELQRAARNLRADAEVHLLLLRLRCLVGIAGGPTTVAQVWHCEPLIALDSPAFALIYRALSRLPNVTPGVHVVDPTDHRAQGLAPSE